MGNDGVFTRYLNENPDFFYSFMQLFRNGEKYDGWNERFRVIYINDSLSNLVDATSDNGADLQYIITL